MITILATFHVPAENTDAFIAMANDLVDATRAETGNVSYELVRGAEDSTNFTFIEKWADQAAIDAHNASTHFTTLIPKMVELSSEAPAIILFNTVK